jgi:hypothetical protein
MTLLYLDIDGPIPPTLLARITQCCRLLRWPIEAIRYDRTRRGWHVVIGVRRRIAFARVVAAQAILGSDRNRELFNLMRSTARVPSFWKSRRNVLYSSHSRGVNFRDTSNLT